MVQAAIKAGRGLSRDFREVQNRIQGARKRLALDYLPYDERVELGAFQPPEGAPIALWLRVHGDGSPIIEQEVQAVE